MCIRDSLHPDERFLTMVGSAVSGVDNPLDYLRTSTSTLNPYNFGYSLYVYGNFPMTVTRYLAEWATGICDAATAGAGQPPAWCSHCLLYTSPSPRDRTRSRMPSSA